MKPMITRTFPHALLLLFGCTLCTVTAWAQPSGGSGWLPEWAEQLGIRLEHTPAPDESFTTLQATVEDPAKLTQLLPEAREGMTVTFSHSGYAAWITEVEGVPVRPCVVVLKVDGSEQEIRLVPDRKTRQLKAGPPPFRGSNLRSGR